MTREPLPPRRDGITMDLVHALADGNHTPFTVTFGFDERRQVREVFCLSRKSGTDLQSLLHQACIAISVGLQHGATMEELRHTLGEDDQTSPPRSIIGCIVRAGALFDSERLNAEIIPISSSPVAQSVRAQSACPSDSTVEVAGSSPAGVANFTRGEIESAVAQAIPLPEDPHEAAQAIIAAEEKHQNGAHVYPTPEDLARVRAATAEHVAATGERLERKDDFEIPAFLRRTPSQSEGAPE